MRVLFHIFSLGAAQTPVALSAQSARKAPNNPAKREFLVFYKIINFQEIVISIIEKRVIQFIGETNYEYELKKIVCNKYCLLLIR